MWHLLVKFRDYLPNAKFDNFTFVGCDDSMGDDTAASIGKAWAFESSDMGSGRV